MASFETDAGAATVSHVDPPFVDFKKRPDCQGKTQRKNITFGLSPSIAFEVHCKFPARAIPAREQVSCIPRIPGLTVLAR